MSDGTFDVSEEGLKRATNHMRRAFFEIQIKRALDKKDAEDGPEITTEQMLLRAVYCLYLDMKELKKRVDKVCQDNANRKAADELSLIIAKKIKVKK